jgi:hypothetical protein
MTSLQALGVVSRLPEPLGDLPGLAWQEAMVLFGGGSGEEVRDTVLVLDPEDGVCRRMGSLPYAARGHQVVEAGGAVYLLGGYDGRTRDDLWRLELGTGKAERLRPIPDPTAWFAATAHQGMIAVVGGFGIPGGYLNRISLYHPDTDSWASVEDAFPASLFPKSSVGANAVVGQGREIWSFGGADAFDVARSRSNALATAARWRSDAGWERLPGVMEPREGLTVVSAGDAAFLVGGMPEAAEPSRTIERVDLESGMIAAVGQLALGRVAPAVALLSGRIFVAGGVVEPLYGMTATVECFTLG